MKLQEALDEEAILKEQMLALMHCFADRFMDRKVEINNLIVLHDHPLIDYDKYALGCMTRADMKKCVELKAVRDELLRSMEEKRKQGRDQSKTGKKETAAKDKPTAIYMVQSWQRTVKQKVTQSFERVREIAFPQLTASNGTEGPLVIEAEMGGHVIHRMYIDCGSSMEILYEHCFSRLQPEIKNQMVPAITSLTGFNGETIWPLGQLRLLVTIGDATHSTKAWMNFMVVKSMSHYNGIIGRPGLKAIQAVPSTVHGMLKFPPSDMTGVPRSVAEHRLNIQEGYTPHNGSWRMCVDFTDLNRACPQDCYPLLEIDWKVESLCGYPFKCFLDAYKGYHQIQLAEADEEKTAFHTGHGVYCYTKMPFGLKNADLKKCIKKSDFCWTAKAEQAFQQLKQHLSELPLLVAPKPQEELIMYLSATYGAVSAVLMTERGTTQTPIYFISCALQGPELNYSPMEKFVMSLVFVAKRLRRYFQTHPITVITDQPIKQVMTRPDVAGRLQKWSIMLREHNITYRPRTSVKGQILADFLIEIPGDVSQAALAAITQEEPWTLFTDGSSCVDGSGAGLILTNLEGVEFTYALRFQFAASNNEAEYEALVAGLRIATQMGVKNIQVNVDSKLIANQVLGTYMAKEDNMIKYLEIVKGLVSGFTTFSISQVPRSKNKQADALSKIASTSFAHLFKQVLVEVLENKSIKEKEVTAVIEEDGLTWMTQLVDYLKEVVLPGDNKEARKLRLKARQYELMEGILYRRSFLTPWLRCVRPLQADYVMREIHEGSCSIHAGPRSVVAKAIRLGYYWPTMHKDARDMIRKCNDYQIHRPGIDIAGPFPEGPGKVKFLIVAMDYFTKLIEAKAVATIIDGQVKKFVWDNIVCRFAVDVVNNDKELRLNLDLLEERRERAAVCEARAKSKMMKYYNARVRGVAFKPGDFVYRSNDASHAVVGGKLGPKWEGPYEVTEALGHGAYKLRSMDGTVLPRTWNVANLKRCYL
uniref:Reverse transcriptase domain-containing protein n=1 Tax=Tanacetum cinerariifolium TaxID=118510 RepID=A0A6L2MDY2_TANCI|nr:reverse transcriptase domain-containing protein [Tanacetum cinerariifolium]